MDRCFDLQLSLSLWNRYYVVNNLLKEWSLSTSNYSDIDEAIKAFPFVVREVERLLIEEREEKSSILEDRLWVNTEQYVWTLVWLIAETSQDITAALIANWWTFKFQIDDCKEVTIH